MQEELIFITLIPASTAIIGRFPGEKLAVACFSINSFFQALTNGVFWAYVVKRYKQFASYSDPRMLWITSQVWFIITIGWLTSILIGFENVYAAYATWILWPNIVAVWGNHRRKLLIESRQEPVMVE